MIQEAVQLMKHLQVPKVFITHLGAKNAIILSEIIDRYLSLIKFGSISQDDYFFIKKEDITKDTGLKRGKIDTGLKELESIGFISTKLGEGKKLFFKINNKKLNLFFFPNMEKELVIHSLLNIILEDGYLQYPQILAQKIGSVETIVLKTLMSKYNYYLKEGKLIDDYFFSSISDLEKDTLLTKKQQSLSLENILNLNLIDIKYGVDNTRYFLIKFENIFSLEKSNYPESKKGDEVESKKSNYPESKKGDEVESKKGNYGKLKRELLKVKKGTTESKKGDINNNINNNNKNNNNNLLLLLEKNFIEREKAEDICIKFSEDRILEVINIISDNKKVNNKAGYIIKALEENWDLNGKKEEIEKKRKFEELKNKQSIELNESEKILILKEQRKILIEKWIKENKEEYDNMYKEVEKRFREKPFSLKTKESMIKLELNKKIFEKIS